MNKAKQFLDRIKYPEKLIKSQQAYYNYLNGLISTQTQSLGKAETYFKKALNLGLNMKADQSMANLNLAGIYMSKRNKRVAQHYLKEAKNLDDKKLLSDQIKEMEKHMKKI
jgi:Tfp pilus assembly protein PilF